MQCSHIGCTDEAGPGMIGVGAEDRPLCDHHYFYFMGVENRDGAPVVGVVPRRHLGWYEDGVMIGENREEVQHP